MGAKIVFSTVKSPSDNRVPEKDESGYSYVTLGALNVINSAGEFYTANEVKEMFTDTNSTLMRRLKSGALRGEVGHPQFQPGMTKTAFFNRNLRIDEQNVCVHIKELVLEETDESSGVSGQGNIVLVKGWIKPSGPKGDFLQKALDNPDENVAFSVRSFTKNSVVNGVVIKKIVQLVTYDYVNEPGISHATKWKTLGVESMDSIEIDLDLLANGDEIDECFECSLENDSEKAMVRELIHNTNSSMKDVIFDW